MGERRLIHNSGHGNWNGEVEKALLRSMQMLKRKGIKPTFEDTDGQEVRWALEELQQKLRQELAKPGRLPRLTQNEPETEMV